MATPTLPPHYAVLWKNRGGQKLHVYAWDNTSGAAKTGDAANITAQLAIDDAASGATNDTNPTEVDATNHPGWYVFDLTQAETNGTVILVTPASGTANIDLGDVCCHTLAWPEHR